MPSVTAAPIPALALPCAKLRLSRAPARTAGLGAILSAELPALPARTAQLLLAAVGHLAPHAVSGRFDRDTADALRAFQRCAGLAVTGVPDRGTADALLGLAG